MRRYEFVHSTIILLFLLVVSGCNFASTFNWRAEDYFGDPEVISLCKAIEAEDLNEIDRLVTDGVDVNVRGKGNVTPLLWAFLKKNSDVFKRLLEHGADPNVKLTSDFANTRNLAILQGHSVLHLAAGTNHPNYFKYVMQHGGDPNLICGARIRVRNSPLMAVIGGPCPDKKEAVQLLIDAGADLEYVSCEMGSTALVQSLSTQYDITLQLLEAGASFNVFYGKDDTFLSRFLRSAETPGSTWTEEQRKGYAAVLKWLEANGANIEGTRKDREIEVKGGKLSPARVAELKKLYKNDLAAKQAAKEQEEQKEKEQ